MQAKFSEIRSDLTKLQHSTNIVSTLCATWDRRLPIKIILSLFSFSVLGLTSLEIPRLLRLIQTFEVNILL